MKSISRFSVKEKKPGKEVPPVVPPEHPLIKPNINPEKEKNEPYKPAPEVLPVPGPERGPKQK